MTKQVSTRFAKELTDDRTCEHISGGQGGQGVCAIARDQTPYIIYLSQIAKCICPQLQMYLSQNVNTLAVVKVVKEYDHTTHNSPL